MPPELFYTGIVNYYDTQRAGGLTSHLLQEHKGIPYFMQIFAITLIQYSA